MAKPNFSLTDKEIEELVVAGGMAPSGGNVQPWKVVVIGKAIVELSLDEKRSSTFLDVGHLASYLVLGCFFENLTIAADSKGLLYSVKMLKVDKFNKPFVRVEFTGRKKVMMTDSLYSAIPKRVTNRRMHEGKRIDEKIVSELKVAAEKYGPNFFLKTLHKESDKKVLANILGVADGIRTFHSELFKQMLNELRWSGREAKDSRDGIDINTLELPGMVKNMLQLMKNYPIVVKTFPKKAFEDQAKPQIIGSSHLCCLCMHNGVNPSTIFQAGRVLERLWLISTKYKLAVHPWTVLPFFLIRVNYFEGEGFNKDEISALKSLDTQIRSLLKLSDDSNPLFIFRLSSAKEPSARSLRLPWRHFTTIR